MWAPMCLRIHSRILLMAVRHRSTRTPVLGLHRILHGPVWMMDDGGISGRAIVSDAPQPLSARSWQASWHTHAGGKSTHKNAEPRLTYTRPRAHTPGYAEGCPRAPLCTRRRASGSAAPLSGHAVSLATVLRILSGCGVQWHCRVAGGVCGLKRGGCLAAAVLTCSHVQRA